MTDQPANRRIDPTERAHLLDESGYAPPIHRFAPSPDLAPLVRRYWMPVWSLPDGRVSVQRVLQYPVCLIVVSADYALLVGPSSGLSTTELSGSGWALGTMLQPAAGTALVGGPVSELTDRAVPLADADLTDAIRAAVGDDPDDPDRQQAAVTAVEEALAPSCSRSTRRACWSTRSSSTSRATRRSSGSARSATSSRSPSAPSSGSPLAGSVCRRSG